MPLAAEGDRAKRGRTDWTSTRGRSVGNEKLGRNFFLPAAIPVSAGRLHACPVRSSVFVFRWSGSWKSYHCPRWTRVGREFRWSGTGAQTQFEVLADRVPEESPGREPTEGSNRSPAVNDRLKSAMRVIGGGTAGSTRRRLVRAAPSAPGAHPFSTALHGESWRKVLVSASGDGARSAGARSNVVGTLRAARAGIPKMSCRSDDVRWASGSYDCGPLARPRRHERGRDGWTQVT